MSFQPLYMKNVDLTLGDEANGENFKCQLRSVQLTPDSSVTKIKTVCPTGQYSDVDEPEWDLELGYLYGKDTEEPRKALARYLLDHHGEKVPFEFLPWAGDETEGYKGTVTIIAGAIGGEQGSFSEQSVTLPLEGQPEPLDVVGAGTGG